MNACEKETFIRSLCDSVRDDLIINIPKMPEEWDGIELRELISRFFAHERVRMNPIRKREFERNCYNI